MSNTLFSLTLLLARRLPGLSVIDSTASGGGVTSLVDSNFPMFQGVAAAAPPNDFYIGGTLWMKDCPSHDTIAEGLLEGKTLQITDSAFSATNTETFTFATITPIDVHAGDLYAVATKDYPRTQLRSAINDALRKMGGRDLTYENAAYITVADQMTYDLPTDVFNVKRLWIASSTTAPYDYIEIDRSRWREMNNDIVFRDFEQQGEAGWRIKLLYNVPLAELTADTDTVPDLYNVDWIIWGAAVEILRWRDGVTKGQDADVRTKLVEAMAQERQHIANYRDQLGNELRTPEYSIWS